MNAIVIYGFFYLMDEYLMQLIGHNRGAVMAQWLGCWTQDSRVVGSIPTPGMVRF